MAAPNPEPGDVIEEYEILERIGGNMGFVFKARHRLLHKVVVLKLVPTDCIADPARLARFQREVRVMGQLEHPNLVTAADARSVDHWHLVAMEWIDGTDLQQLLRARGQLPIAAACEVARQAAQALQYAHEHGLIHRDIKPSNLMLTRSGTLKVIDMGLALIQEDSAAQLTKTGLVLGTMSYCAPEQFRDASHVDIRADIYSLGCTLYHLLTGKPPYSERKTFAEVVEAHLHEPFPGLVEAGPDVPSGLEAVLTRMTAKDREARFSTPGEVVEALAPFAWGADLRPLVPERTPPAPTAHDKTVKVTPKPGAQRRAAGGEQKPKARWTRRAALLGVPTAVGGAYFLGKWPRFNMDKWEVLYDLLDDKLACFMGYVGTVSLSTKFLIYSRGTDVNWKSPDWRKKWVEQIEARFPKLEGRINTMLIPKERATFKHEDTAKDIKERIELILGPSGRDPTPKLPVLVLMDTTADRGVYDEENKGRRTNAEVLQMQLQDRPWSGIPVPISIDASKRNWRGEEIVLGHNPSLVIFHRSAFFHPVNEQLELGYPPS